MNMIMLYLSRHDVTDNLTDYFVGSVSLLDMSLKDFPMKGRNVVQTILCHPDSPLVMLGMNDGLVQVTQKKISKINISLM